MTRDTHFNKIMRTYFSGAFYPQAGKMPAFRKDRCKAVINDESCSIKDVKLPYRELSCDPSEGRSMDGGASLTGDMNVAPCKSWREVFDRIGAAAYGPLSSGQFKVYTITYDYLDPFFPRAKESTREERELSDIRSRKRWADENEERKKKGQAEFQCPPLNWRWPGRKELLKGQEYKDQRWFDDENPVAPTWKVTWEMIFYCRRAKTKFYEALTDYFVSIFKLPHGTALILDGAAALGKPLGRPLCVYQPRDINTTKPSIHFLKNFPNIISSNGNRIEADELLSMWSCFFSCFREDEIFTDGTSDTLHWDSIIQTVDTDVVLSALMASRRRFAAAGAREELLSQVYIQRKHSIGMLSLGNNVPRNRWPIVWEPEIIDINRLYTDVCLYFDAIVCGDDGTPSYMKAGVYSHPCDVLELLTAMRKTDFTPKIPEIMPIDIWLAYQKYGRQVAGMVISTPPSAEKTGDMKEMWAPRSFAINFEKFKKFAAFCTRERALRAKKPRKSDGQIAYPLIEEWFLRFAAAQISWDGLKLANGSIPWWITPHELEKAPCQAREGVEASRWGWCEQPHYRKSGAGRKKQGKLDKMTMTPDQQVYHSDVYGIVYETE
jgi:hypothetical protein